MDILLVFVFFFVALRRCCWTNTSLLRSVTTMDPCTYSSLCRLCWGVRGGCRSSPWQTCCCLAPSVSVNVSTWLNRSFRSRLYRLLPSALLGYISEFCVIQKTEAKCFFPREIIDVYLTGSPTLGRDGVWVSGSLVEAGGGLKVRWSLRLFGIFKAFCSCWWLWAGNSRGYVVLCSPVDVKSSLFSWLFIAAASSLTTTEMGNPPK